MAEMHEALAEAQVAEAHRHHSKAQFLWVWAGLLVATAIEVLLAYEHLAAIRMLTLLMGLSVIKAALIIAYFMHLKFEVQRMRRLLMVSVVICLCLMCVFFADAFRILQLGVR